MQPALNMFFTPLSAVRRNLLVSASIALLIGMFSVDTSEFRFFGVQFEEKTLATALCAVTGFYLIGYTFKALYFLKWIISDMEQDGQTKLQQALKTIESSFATFDEDRLTIINAQQRYRREFLILAIVEASVPLILGIAGITAIYPMR